MPTTIESWLELAARFVGSVLDSVLNGPIAHDAIALTCLGICVVLTAGLSLLIVRRKPTVEELSGLPRLQQRPSRRPDLLGVRQSIGERTAIGALEPRQLREIHFHRNKLNTYLVVEHFEKDHSNATIYVQNAVYVYPKEFSPDRTYRVRIVSPTHGQITANLKIRPRIASSRFEGTTPAGAVELKVAFNSEAIDKHHILGELADERCEISFDDAVSPAQAAWLAMRGLHPDADINMGALFVIIGVPVTLLSTLLCKWLDQSNFNILGLSGTYLAASAVTLMAVYLVRRQWRRH